MSTLFTRIINREIPADIVYEDDQAIAFNDIDPQAPMHVLIVPKKEIPTINDISEEDEALVGHLYRIAAQLAHEKGIAEDGYRVVMNCNEYGGQSVYHIHLHMMGGRRMGWPAG
ncbi:MULTISPECIES: histidine triad nucleotide-binding protein [Zymobacter]|uniref:Diadenosine tetraphosphate(Ap4A) hydrolase n=1 Tax=Zymobacter palmae TaxID=33074 RepID=A0A348HGS4_9GAMM|nr:histidine triad nucleotide-binding protein [Zymobacter palmae]BBG30826.1 diadenosine tetraphosphate(Ap4A) hydrolase [Zymobacter palmae]